MTTSQVRVAIRLRPLAAKELSSGGSPVLSTTSTTVALSNRKFTYDAVYDNVSQCALYNDVAPPLLEAFLGGYNATVLAYGQTGSGKTYSMGSEAHTTLDEGGEDDGLIPRFMCDIFSSLEQRKAGSSAEKLLDYSVEATFLEVYGEDIHDLLDEDRKSLPIREDSSGQVVVVGLSATKITSNTEAMEVLNTGTMNRTTAATLMNVTSSRSHAIFTVNLRQVTCGADGVEVGTNSKFTFVDLAGSERMKKTGAEGTRMKEGIAINEGLLALGNVINALADEERLAKGEKVHHVPYRQSKLTRLLQDALGGNSQTLFLACASPSDTNASETLSTLQYANRARNIKNKPTKNVDATALELQNLRALTNVLKCELIKKSFAPASSEKTTALGEVDEALLQRADVLAYMTSIDEKVTEITGCNAVSTYPVCISAKARPPAFSQSKVSSYVCRSSTQSINSSNTAVSVNSSGRNDVYDVDPDEDMKILDELLELQHRDQQFSTEQENGQEQLDSMEGEIVAQEERLNKLRENLIMYHNIKAKYEKLMCEVHNLEAEKQALAEALEKVQGDPTKGCSMAIRRKLQDVEESLVRARSETRKHQAKVRQAEQESQKVKVLERKIQDMKHARVNLIKKQKEAAAKHKEYTNQKTREINALKRKEKASNILVSKIQGENQKFRHNLERSRAQNEKLSEKLKQTESHLVRLLTERRSKRFSSRKSKTHAINIHGFEGSDKFASTNEEVNSLRFLLEKTVCDRVNLIQQLNAYDAKVVEHGKLLQSIASELKVLNKSRSSKSDASIKEIEDNVHDYQLKLELIESDLEEMRTKYPRLEEYYFEEDETKKQMREALPALKIISKIDVTILRTLFIQFLDIHANVELQRRSLKELVARKESTLQSFEKELEAQYAKVETFTKKLGQHRRLSSCDGSEVNGINGMKKVIESTSAQLQLCLQEKNTLSSELDEVRKALNYSQREYADVMDRFALNVAKQNLTQTNEETSRMLIELQKIWADIGLPMNERQAVRYRLKNCVEDACKNMLVEASKLRDDRRNEIESLKHKLQVMHASLGINETFSKITADSHSIEDQIKALNYCINGVRHEYENALDRCRTVFSAAKSLISELDLDDTAISSNLKQLLLNGQLLLKSNNSRPSEPILCHSFLDLCEKEVKKLKLVRSNRLLSTVDMFNDLGSIAREMDVSPKELASMALYSIKRLSCPVWWDSGIWKQVEDAFCKQRSGHTATVVFINHLRLFVDTVKSIAHGRRLLSDALKNVVEQSEEAILATAEGCEMDVKELYESMQKSLSKLPPLSKQHAKGCLDEMKMFTAAAESIAQSEIETLTILWEGLNISSGEKGRFWSKIEETSSKAQSQTTGPFDIVRNECNSDTEEWVLKTATEAAKVQRVLGLRVYRLKSIHTEVERLKAKQHAKNRIMSLNGELKLLSTKLTDFEEKAGNRQKLTNKRVNSSSLLEEERFRKHMQGKFASKLETMRQMLNEWEAAEGSIDDSDMLSEVVRDLLENSHRIDAWMNEKIRFMHLRTSKSKVREADKHNAQSSARPSSRQVPTKTPTVSSTVKPRLISKSTVKNACAGHSAALNDNRHKKTPLAGTNHNTKQQDENASRKKSPTIEVPEVLAPNPFGDLLADTPVFNENKSSHF